MCCLLLLVGYPKFFRPAAPPNLGWDPPQIWDGCTHVVLKTGTDEKRGAVAIMYGNTICRIMYGNTNGVLVFVVVNVTCTITAVFFKSLFKLDSLFI